MLNFEKKSPAIFWELGIFLKPAAAPQTEEVEQRRSARVMRREQPRHNQFISSKQEDNG